MILKIVNVLIKNSDMTIKDYWRYFDILNVIQFIDAARERVSANRVTAVWKELDRT